MDVPCSLCFAEDPKLFHQDQRRIYLRCPVCSLVFVPPAYFLSPAAEKAEYDRHKNSPADPGYRRFLGRLYEPLVTHLPANSQGLDFGSGPGPTLSVMLEEAGHQVALYDSFYAPDTCVFERSYAFITASEVVEHLHHPYRELQRLWACLSPAGWLGIMTKRVRNQEAFARWHYKNDPTHVCFFSEATFHWLAQHWQANLMVVGADVVLFQKRAIPATPTDDWDA